MTSGDEIDLTGPTGTPAGTIASVDAASTGPVSADTATASASTDVPATTDASASAASTGSSDAHIRSASKRPIPAHLVADTQAELLDYTRRVAGLFKTFSVHPTVVTVNALAQGAVQRGHFAAAASLLRSTITGPMSERECLQLAWSVHTGMVRGGFIAAGEQFMRAIDYRASDRLLFQRTMDTLDGLLPVVLMQGVPPSLPWVHEAASVSGATLSGVNQLAGLINGYFSDTTGTGMGDDGARKHRAGPARHSSHLPVCGPQPFVDAVAALTHAIATQAPDGLHPDPAKHATAPDPRELRDTASELVRQLHGTAQFLRDRSAATNGPALSLRKDLRKLLVVLGLETMGARGATGTGSRPGRDRGSSRSPSRRATGSKR